jgi:hypothetical protein
MSCLMANQPLTVGTSTFEAGGVIENFDFDRFLNAEDNNIKNFNILDDDGTTTPVVVGG